MKKTKNEKRRLLLNKRLDQKTIEMKRAKFARPADSKLFVKTNGSEVVRAPLNKRLVAIILAIVMVVGLIPAGVFMLRPKAAGNGLEAVEMSVRVNGADDFATAIIPGGEISKTVQDAEYDIALPDSFLYRKAVVIDSSDNSETEIFSAGRLGNKTYYSLNENSATGTLLNDETQRLVLVLAEKHNVTLNYNNADGDANTSAIDGTYVWGGDSLRVQGTPKTDREVSSITYSINNGTPTSTPISNNGTTIPASSITGDIAVNVNFGAVDKYSITEVDNDNHGGLTTGTTANDKAGANPVSPGGTASFYIYSESNTGGSNFIFNMLSINGVDIGYPIEKGTQYTRFTPFHNDGEVRVTLVETDTALRWNSGDYNLLGQDKHRSLYLIEVDNVHEDLDVSFHFKQKADRQIMIKGLRGIQETGAATESRSNVTKYIHLDQVIDDSGWLGVGVPVRNYRFVKNENNFYSAYYNQDIGGNFSGSIPSNNVYFYRVKPGYNPYSVAGTNVYAQYFDDNGQLISTVPSADLLAGDSSADRPDVVIQKASVAVTAGAQEAVRNDLGRLADWEVVNTFFVWLYEKLGAFDSEIRYWGTSDILTNGDVAQAKENSDYVWNSARDLALTTIQTEEQDPSIRWYAIALNQNAANNQQLYVNADLYQYYLRLDLGTGGSLANSSDRFNASGSVLTEKDAYKHTVDDREKYITFPAETPTNSNGSVIFGGWRAIDANGDPILRNGEEVIYQSLEQIKFDWQNLSYSYGKDTGKDSDVNQVLAFEAVWRDLRTANITTITVETWAEVPEGTPGAVSKEIPSDDGIVTKYYQQIENKREIQPVGQETLILNYPEPENAQFYELNTTISVLNNVPGQQSNVEQIPEDNQFSLYYDLAYEDLTVTKKVLGNPSQLDEGFLITTTITKPENAPLDTEQALDNIIFSNGDSSSATHNTNSITYEKYYGRSESVTLSNVPHGWGITISEPKAQVNGSDTPDYETTITSIPETAGNQIAEEEGYTGPTRWTGTLNSDTSITVTNKSDSYLVLDKTLSRNEAGSYDLTLEAFATGDIEKESKVEKTPTDFVLVLDQSGSMAYGDMPTSYTRDNRSSWKISDIPDGENATAYYYYDETADKYYRVFKKHGVMYEYVAPNSKYADDITGDVYEWFTNDDVELANVSHPGGYSYKDPSDGKYYSLNASVYGYLVSGGSGGFWDNVMGYRCYLYYYDSNNNRQYVQTSPNKTDSKGAYYIYRELFNARLTSWCDIIDKPLYIRHAGYSQLCYKDENGVEHTLIDADYCNSSGNAVGGECQLDQKAPGSETNTTEANWTGTLYRANTSTNETRLQSLNTALKQFVASVSEQTDSYGTVPNRVAIVGFSSEGGNYNNTELLTGVNITHGTSGSMSTTPGTTSGYSLDGKTHNGTQYNPSSGNAGGISSTVYQGTLLDVTDNSNVSNIVRDNEGVVTGGSGNLFSAIDAVTAYGGTKPAYGLKMAEQIFANRGDTSEYEKQSTGEPAKRNTVVVFFTDGRPGNNDTVDQYEEANAVVAAAKNLKTQKDSDQTPLNTKIYSIGVFGESDGNPLTYPAYSVEAEGNSRENTARSNANNIHTYDFDLQYVRDQVSFSRTTSGWSTTYYYKKDYYFRDCIAGAYGYPEQADDTIADYMRTVSSEYPAAEAFSYGSPDEGETYIQLINDARGQRETDQRYYYMASDHKNLLAAFEKVSETITEEIQTSTSGMSGTNALLRDVINQSDFDLPQNPSDLDVKVYTVIGSQTEAQQQQSLSTVSFLKDGNGNEVRVDVTDKVGVNWSGEESGLTTLDITGFDYGANFIGYGKMANDPNSDDINKGTNANEGKKLVVVISGLEPKITATGELKSNTTDSGIYKMTPIGDTEETTVELMNAFPVPQMYRFAYNLRESGVKVDDEFDIGFTRNGNGADGIMVTYPNGNRDTDNLQNGTYTWVNAGNNDAIYFETFDEDAYLSATVPSAELDQETFDYSVSLIDKTGTTPEGFDYDFDIIEDSSTIHVSNVSNSRTVIIKEFTRGVEGEADYSDKEKEFPIQVKLTKADGETLVNDPITATIVRKDDPEHPREEVLHFERNNGVVEIELADGDYITFDTLKNYKITVWEGESDHEGYIDSYAPDENGAEIGTGVIVVDDDNNNNVIEVINRLEQNPDVDSGVVDSNDPSKVLFAVLAALGGLAAIGAGIFLWKKKDEFVEQ